MFFYAITIFLSAFLLFQVQPIIAKMVLPWFGGTSAVWTTCMLFFQLVLLAGYAYAHWLNGRHGGRIQASVHTALLAVSLAALPIIPKPAWKPAGDENPSWLLLGLLAATVGLPYFLLSTTSPLLQAWFARSRKGATPYRLFALSNLASMVALLSYPPLVEPNLPTHMQAQVWSLAYICFAVLCAVLAWSGARWSVPPGILPTQAPIAEAPRVSLRLLWMGLAACASALLLAITTFLTQDVAAIPFLWIVPLSIYLLSFLISFESPGLYWRKLYLGLLPAALGYSGWRIWQHAGEVHRIVPVIVLLSLSLFVFCMVCHGELASLKPHPRYLTSFYLMISVGGAAGGLFVGLLAPHVFPAYYEFPIGLGLCAALVVAVLFVRQFLGTRRWPKIAILAAAAAYVVFMGVVIHDDVKDFRLVARNFYGRLGVFDDADPADDEEATRHLVHGVINHGEQALRPQYRRMPITYFCPSSGVGIAMRALEGTPRRIGILGLGCGTLAAYGQPGDMMRIYEINPLVLQFAQSEFTYLRDTAARTEVVLGDGRLSLEREPSQQFDLLVMDAFSGDSVPVHLITREAFRTYFRHLRPDGILAVNISNRYLDLRPVIERSAAAFGKIAMLFDYTPDEGDFLCFSCSWILVMDPATRPRLPAYAGQVLQAHMNFRPWTDDFSNMHRILK